MLECAFDFLNATSNDELGTISGLEVSTLKKPWVKMNEAETNKEVIRAASSGSPFVGLFLEQAPQVLHKSLNIRDIQAGCNPYSVTLTCDFAAFLTPEGMSYPEVRTQLLSLWNKLRTLAEDFDVSKDVVRGLYLQTGNEVLKGRRDYSLKLGGVNNLEAAQEEINNLIRKDPVLNGVYLLAAKRLRVIGRWSWNTVTEEDLFGYMQGPATDWRLKKYLASKNADN